MRAIHVNRVERATPRQPAEKHQQAGAELKAVAETALEARATALPSTAGTAQAYPFPSRTASLLAFFFLDWYLLPRRSVVSVAMLPPGENLAQREIPVA